MNWIRYKLQKMLGRMVLYHYQEAIRGYYYYSEGTLGYDVSKIHHEFGELYYEIRKAIK